jgi:secreted Zn-dependent insulinase-like peptidase
VVNPNELNNAIYYLCHITQSMDLKIRALGLVLGQIGSEMAFDFLRTKLQLGYTVFAGYTTIGSNA